MNSYNYRQDPEGKFLLGILKAVAPVCGGINLEYFFSRVDNQKLGAGSKLPHNVMGLIGVANGADGDLRPGLPSQMIEVHDPVRLLVIVEHDPQVVLRTVRNSMQKPTNGFKMNGFILSFTILKKASSTAFGTGNLKAMNPFATMLTQLHTLYHYLNKRRTIFLSINYFQDDLTSAFYSSDSDFRVFGELASSFKQRKMAVANRRGHIWYSTDCNLGPCGNLGDQWLRHSRRQGPCAVPNPRIPILHRPAF
jgi:hypothetical protein